MREDKYRLMWTFETGSVRMTSHCLYIKEINIISRNFHFCKFETQIKAIIKLFLYCIRMEITVLYFRHCIHKSWFTVANISLPSNNLCIAYDDDIHYTLNHRCVCKRSSGYSETRGKIMRVKINDLFHMWITGIYFIKKSLNHTYLYNKKLLFFLLKHGTI
jgi:hypothetical protein